MLRTPLARATWLFCILILLNGCIKSPKPKPQVVERADQLFHTVAESYHLQLARAVSQTDGKSYYYEVAHWLTETGDLSAKVDYQYLLNNYVFTDESITSMEDDLITEYEDSLLSQQLLVAVGDPPFRGAYIQFTVQDGDCFYYRSFKLFGSAFGAVANSPFAVLVGDSRFASFVCDFSGRKMTEDRIKAWIDGVSFRLVHPNQL